MTDKNPVVAMREQAQQFIRENYPSWLDNGDRGQDRCFTKSNLIETLTLFATSQLQAANERIEELKEALGHYADDKNWNKPNKEYFDIDWSFQCVYNDNGNWGNGPYIASRALEGKGEVKVCGVCNLSHPNNPHICPRRMQKM
jgi:hypothetical protein